MNPPSNIPEKGYYYHYKHDPAGEINNYAYEVIGIGSHTEEDSTFLVVYRPLYESSVYNTGKFFDLRPVEMFIGKITKEGMIFPRFTKITDNNLISKLGKIAEKMYN